MSDYIYLSTARPGWYNINFSVSRLLGWQQGWAGLGWAGLGWAVRRPSTVIVVLIKFFSPCSKPSAIVEDSPHFCQANITHYMYINIISFL